MADPAPNAAPTPDDAAVDDELRLRARALGVLGGSAWHEVAQPLNGLRFFTGMLRSAGVTASQVGVDPMLIEDAVGSLERLSRALTDLARGSDRRVPLHELVDGVLSMAGYLTVDVEVAIDVRDDTPEPAIHNGVVRVALASLLVDALTALGGPRAARGALAVRAASRGDTVTLVLEDDGIPGEPPSLPEVTRLLAVHGAAVRHDRGPDTGNRVTLALPRRAGVPATIAPSPAGDEDAAAPDPRPAVMRVLVCDDDEVIRGLILRTLARQGVTAVAAASGSEALGLVEGGGIDVILCDDRMPGMTGRALHAAVSASRPELGRRFVLMSGDMGSEDVAAFGRATGIPVLAKPFDLARLAAVLGEAAAR